MIEALLVANRGEIAMRAFRAANELGVRSVAVYAPEDRDSVHRLKADESYEIGDAGPPGQQLPRRAADRRSGGRRRRRRGLSGLRLPGREPGAGAPLRRRGRARSSARPPACSGSPATRRARVDVGQRAPACPVLAAHRAGRATRACGATRPPSARLSAVRQGGAGRRRTRDAAGRAAGRAGAALDGAMREAQAAFGDGTVYLEQAMLRARHIEVQILADAAGGIVHLFERDCSVQRRHQKVIEVTPAPNLDPVLRERICAAARRRRPRDRLRQRGNRRVPARRRRARFAFIEMNPRIQVEHTVTEETTDVDLVRAQILIAGGATLDELGLAQDGIRQRGVALQCRVTTENPANGFRPDAGPDHGVPVAGRRGDPARRGLRVRRRRGLAVLRPAAGQDHRARAGSARARRRAPGARSPSCGSAGVSTNQSVPRARCCATPTFLAGGTHTSFVDEHPDLVSADPGADRASRLLTRLDRRDGQPRARTARRGWSNRAQKLPPLAGEPATGSRQRLHELGPAAFAAALRAQTRGRGDRHDAA